jgi:hypothetical protein
MFDDLLQEAGLTGPTLEYQSIRRIIRDNMRAMKPTLERWREFSSPQAAVFAAIGSDPRSREELESRMDSLWNSRSALTLGNTAGEVVIGAGLHAAIYCAARVKAGYPRPLVLEARPRVGGAFAVSRRPSFWLNSRNRPGDLGVPGRAEALNVLPGGPVQPSDLTGHPYGTNADMAYSIRVALMMNAEVRTNYCFTGVSDAFSRVLWRRSDGTDGGVRASRIIMALGLGENRTLGSSQNKVPRAMTFDQFMARMDDPHPLRGMRRVAVIGGGDGARAAVEALIGQGPVSSAISVDHVERVDWFGCPRDSCESWLEGERKRYAAIAQELPSSIEPARPHRIYPLSLRPVTVSAGYDGAVVNARRYDNVIVATGQYHDPDFRDQCSWYSYKVGGRSVARQANPYRLFRVGPYADFELTDSELELYGRRAESKVAVFRLAERTALLATTNE